jgi:peptidoglycan hydrolase-like protein with peptidoglycan-binding domain
VYSATNGQACNYVTKNVEVEYQNTSTGLPPGCTSNVGFSPTTGQPCSGTPGSASSSEQVSAPSNTVSFTRGLRLGAQGDDVRALQAKLRAEGVYGGALTGYYGPMTRTAVGRYQAKYGLPAVGVVGPRTLELLNK